jgi:hypothetical protein
MTTSTRMTRKEFNTTVVTLAKGVSPEAHKALLANWANLDRTVTPRTALKRIGVVVAKAEPKAKASTRTAKKALSQKAPVSAPVAKPTKVLTKARAAKIRARWGKYAGLSREAMIAAGLKGYHMPTGELRKSLSTNA